MNTKTNKTRELTLAAILTALSIVITFSPVKLVLPFFTLTLGVHVPTLIAMFISPWVAIMTVIGSCVGFLVAIPAPNNVLVMLRAALHLLFVLVGMKMINKDINIFIVLLATSVLHALAEGILVYFLTPIIIPNNETALLTAGWIAFAGTFVHHYLDTIITVPILLALVRAKIIIKPYFLKKRENAAV